MKRFIQYRLEPAKVAPPSINTQESAVIVGNVTGIARRVDAEDQSWNQWPGEGVRLLNNTVAHWFLLDITTTDGSPLRWVPLGTGLELNQPGNLLRPAETQEQVLEELLFFAYQQERHVLDGDLVERARGSGALRSAYVGAEGSVLHGLIAFPLTLNKDTASFLGRGGPPADYHVVSMRLTVRVETPTGSRDLVWFFD